MAELDVPETDWPFEKAVDGLVPDNSSRDWPVTPGPPNEPGNFVEVEPAGAPKPVPVPVVWPANWACAEPSEQTKLRPIPKQALHANENFMFGPADSLRNLVGTDFLILLSTLGAVKINASIGVFVSIFTH